MHHGIVCGTVTAPTVAVKSDFGTADSDAIAADKIRAWQCAD